MTVPNGKLKTLSQELHRKYKEADAKSGAALNAYAYGEGPQSAVREANKAREAVWKQLLSLHNLTETQWLRASASDRRKYWGY